MEGGRQTEKETDTLTAQRPQEREREREEMRQGQKQGETDHQQTGDKDTQGEWGQSAREREGGERGRWR